MVPVMPSQSVPKQDKRPMCSGRSNSIEYSNGIVSIALKPIKNRLTSNVAK
jgi:hypothetical protein